MMHSRNKTSLFAIFWALLLTLSANAQAALLSYHGVAEIDAVEPSVPSSEISIGDQFDFSFTYDDAIADVEPSPGAGSFPAAMTAFTLTRRSTNTGTWDPSVGTFSLPDSVSTQASAGRVLFLADGSGFDPLGGGPFLLAQLTFVGVAIGDSGLGQTISEQIGGPLSDNLADFTSASLAFFNDPVGDGTPRFAAGGSITEFVMVPEPASGMLLWLSAGALVGRNKRRVRSPTH